jgi:hypothetical protein
MKRLGIFALLGPLISLVIFYLANAISDGELERLDAFTLISTLFLAYSWVLIPACLASLVDGYLDRRVSPGLRVFAMLGVGYVFAVLVTATLIGWQSGIVSTWFVWGFVGMVPAAVCSWLSGRA